MINNICIYWKKVIDNICIGIVLISDGKYRGFTDEKLKTVFLTLKMCQMRGECPKYKSKMLNFLNLS